MGLKEAPPGQSTWNQATKIGQCLGTSFCHPIRIFSVIQVMFTEGPRAEGPGVWGLEPRTIVFLFLKKALEEQFSQKKSNLLTHMVRVQSLNLDCWENAAARVRDLWMGSWVGPTHLRALGRIHILPHKILSQFKQHVGASQCSVS